MAVFESEKSQEARGLGKKLQGLMKAPSKPISIYEASTQSGLALRDAKIALMSLVSHYRGHISATSTGELLFSFPTGFSRPWYQAEKSELAWKKIKKTSLGIAKFVARAWITIVMIGYVVVFALILLALMFSKNDDRDSGGSFGGTMAFHFLIRMIMDSIFWTFHPFSPFAVQYRDPYASRGFGRGRYNQEPKVPFYEKVNNFFFGPEKEEEDPLQTRRMLLAEIKANGGTIGLFDVMRISGYSRPKAEAFLTSLMLDYEGDVQVSDQGGITYTFPQINKAENIPSRRPKSIWEKPVQLHPFTGTNTSGSNFLITGLNGFNFVMSLAAIAGGWTVAKLQWMFQFSSQEIPEMLMPPMPTGTPLILGWIPFWFSLVLFAIPVLRWLSRPKDKQNIRRENGRRGILKTILSKLGFGGYREKDLERGWESVAGSPPSSSELTKAVVKMGGELDVKDSGETRYVFQDLESESTALDEERRKASKSEVHVGEVVFSSEN